MQLLLFIIFLAYLNTLIFLNKQPVFKQLTLRMQFVQQLLGVNDLSIGTNINNINLQAKEKQIFFQHAKKKIFLS